MLQKVVESTNETAFVGLSWINNDDLLILNTSVVDGRGARFLEFEVKAIVQSLCGSINNDGSLFLGAKGAQVLTTAKIPNTRIITVGNNSVAVKMLNHNGDEVGDVGGDLTCQANDGIIQPMPINILETEYDLYCSTVKILGVDLVLALAMRVQGPETFKDKQETVFENYAQIKDTSVGQEGTGLGLGIVQSLVRLMGEEIEIMDKEVGKKGTCFKFNAYFSICETDQRSKSDDTGSHVSAYMSPCQSFSPQGSSSELTEGSRVIFFIPNEERSRVCQRFMDRQRIESLVVRTCKELASSLKRMIGHVRVHSLSSSSKKSDGLQSVAGSRTSSPRLEEAQFNSPAQIDQEMPSTHKRTRTRESLLAHFTLIIIDIAVGTFSELVGLVAEIRRNLSTGGHRIVWLDSSGFGNTQLQGLRDTLQATDIILFKPLHGSRLYQVLKLLLEYGGERPAEMSEVYPPNYLSSGSLIASDNLGWH
ncbi:hypothetical protein DCAR_0103477 [Daucus carota subsp. sativus]|nr:PREDICTED: histidine kinase CKI1-like [Daucus carota subsp. sativus]WOG84294.1 hypothetical protein DCAR_0103477 [Daucus carota subsp. sativus]